MMGIVEDFATTLDGADTTIVQDVPCDTAVSNLAYILVDLTSFIGTHPQFDDITMLSLVVLG